MHSANNKMAKSWHINFSVEHAVRRPKYQWALPSPEDSPCHGVEELLAVTRALLNAVADDVKLGLSETVGRVRVLTR